MELPLGAPSLAVFVLSLLYSCADTLVQSLHVPSLCKLQGHLHMSFRSPRCSSGLAGIVDLRLSFVVNFCNLYAASGRSTFKLLLDPA